MAQPAFDLTGLTPLDASGLTPLSPDAAAEQAPPSGGRSGFDLSGLKPLDVTGLKPAGEPSPSVGDYASAAARGAVRGIPVVGPIISANEAIEGATGAPYGTESVKGATAGAKDLVASSLKGASVAGLGHNRAALDAIDRIDQGLPVAEAEDPIGYLQMTPEQRAGARAALEGTVARQDATSPTERPLWRAGEAIEGFGKEALAPGPGFESSWTRDISQAAGSMLGGIAISLIPVVGPYAAGGTFITSGMGQQAEDAIKHGATPEQIERAARFGSVAGATDVVDTLLPMLGSTGKAMGLIKRVGLAAIKGAFAEGGQEGLQQFLQNLIASNIYDPNRDLTEDVAYNALIGAIVGGPSTALFSAAERHPVDRPITQSGDGSIAPGGPGIPAGAVPAETVLPTEQTPVGENIQATPPVMQATPENMQPAPPTDVSGLSPVPPQPSFQDLLNDPRSADEIRADLARQQAADEAAQAWAPSADWQEVPAQRMADVGRDASLQVRQEDGKTLARIAPAPGTREAPVQLEQPADVNAGAEQTATPTPAQAEAGNYSKRHLKWNGLDISIETEAGQDRTGVGPDGKPWSVTLQHPYGYIRETEGKDGDHFDITMGPTPQAGTVFVVDQVDPSTHKFDEHKAFGGFDSEASALTAYNSSFSDGSGPGRMGAVTPMSVPVFTQWVKRGKTSKPLTYVAPKPLSSAPALPKGPISLLQFIASKGGLRPDPGGELKALGLTGRGGRIIIPGLGYRNVVRPTGMSLDQAREAAVEAGYLHDAGRLSGSLNETTPNHLLDAMAEELGGRRRFRQGEEHVAAEHDAKHEQQASEQRLADARDEIAAVVKEQGLLATDEQIAQAAQLTLTSTKDAIDAIEHVLEQQALADREEAEQHLPQEQTHAAEAHPATAVGTGQAVAPAQHEPARPSSPENEAPPQRHEHGADQRGAGEAESVATFRTAKGSTYQVHADGTTTRNKAYRPEHGEKEQGPQPRSERTVYLTEKDAQRLAPPASGHWRMVLGTEGQHLSLAMENKDGNWGISPSQRMVPYTAKPAKGAIPLELWNAKDLKGKPSFGKIHFGNAITDVTQAGTPGVGDIVDQASKEAEQEEAQTERTPAGQQHVIPGAEKIGQGEQATRGAEKPLRPKVAQKPADQGLFSDESGQTDLVDMAKKPPNVDLKVNTPTPQEQRQQKAAADAKWWKEDLTPAGREMVAQATGMPAKQAERIAKASWQHIVPALREQLASVRGTDRDPMKAAEAPTWAEVLGALPKDEKGRPDLDVAFGLMDEITGKKKTAYRDLEPSQQTELLRRVKDGAWTAAAQINKAAPSDEASNFQIDPAKRVETEEEAQRKGGQYTAIATRLKPFAAERGYGDTPLLAQNDALRRLKTTYRLKEPVAKNDTGRTEQPKAPETGPSDSAPQIKLATMLAERLKSGKPITAKILQEMAGHAYDGTLAQGKFDRKDMFDALELAVNMRVKQDPDLRVVNGGWQRAVQQLEKLLASLPTQTVRSEEQVSFQQFSTPPHYSLAVAYAANLREGDTVLEPSAGTGSLVAAATHPGVKIVANELSSRRADLLRELVGKDGQVLSENAEQIANLPRFQDVKPTVVVMNPPFSQTAGRMGDKRDINVGANHIKAALSVLEPGGRLVAIVGRGMTMGAPRFKDWWGNISKAYTVRANIGVDGSVYGKYGTHFGTRLLVIDKIAPTEGAKPVLEDVQTVDSLMRALEPIRNGRSAEQQRTEPSRPAVAEGGQGAAGAAPAAPANPGTVGNGKAGGGRVAGPRPAGSQQPGGSDVRVETGERPGVAGGESGGGRPGGKPAASTGGSIKPESGRNAPAQPGVQPLAEPSPSATASGQRVAVEHAAPGTQTASEISDSLYESYTPQRVRIKGAAKHPGPLVESAAMSSVEPPTPTYSPSLPKAVISDGLLSLPQLEVVVYAGQAHGKMLPAGEGETARRRGFFIGDGTGVGKGREIAGIILDNWSQSRKKAVWVSEKRKLMNDAKRDWKGLGQNDNHIFNAGKVKTGEPIGANQGIAFITYDTLKGGMSDQAAIARGGFVRGQQVTVNGQPGKVQRQEKGPRGAPGEVVVKLDAGTTVQVAPSEVTASGEKNDVKTRVDQLVDWFGKDFDGVIAFDEAHNMGNASAVRGKRGMKEAAQKALAGIALQERLPNARVVYVSATGATEVSNLAYADRLGLWGRGTPFADRNNFISEVTSGGIAAMELIARDMKQLGLYTARNLSYDGVEYSRIEHKLDKNQREIYDTLAEAWQNVLRNINAALEVTGGDKAKGAKSAAMSAFWGGHQRFFNQIITSLQMPSVVKAVEADLKAGRQAVLQLTNTNEAAQERAASKAETAEDIEDLDITPRDQIIQLVEKSFPTQQYETYVDENGNTRSRAVVDSEGNPVQNKEAVAMRDALVERLASIRVPQGPLDMVLDHFGIENVAEVTGRGRRFVMKEDEQTGEKKRREESRPGSANQSETDAFQAGKKKVLVFSEAGGTGASYHADNTSASKNARRSHYLVQAGWRADKAVQGFGRTHRTNQASAPIFQLVTTDLDGQKRFISSIARRLGQLGALTKGQRQAGDQGIFSARDNLESREAETALDQFWRDLDHNRVEGVSPAEFQEQTGLQLRDEQGNAKDAPEITQFLNRLLSLKIDRQNTVFQAFSNRMDAVIEARQQAGLLDVGLETVRADKITKDSEQTVHTIEESGAKTEYVKLTLADRFKPISFASVANSTTRKVEFWVKSPRGKIYAVTAAPHRTEAQTGAIVQQARIINPVSGSRIIEAHHVLNLDRKDAKWSAVDKVSEAKELWEKETAAAPEFIERDLHLITGAILPIWDRLKGSTRVVRLQTTGGKHGIERLIGRVVPESRITETLQALGAEGGKVEPKKLFDTLMSGGRAKLANGWTLSRRLVAGEQRIELKGPSSASEGEQVKKDGVFTERIAYETRYFVPTDAEQGPKTLAALTEHRPVVEMRSSGDTLASRQAPGPAQAFRPVYEEIKAEQGGIGTVYIGDIIERTGLPKEVVHEALLESQRRGEVTLHGSSASWVKRTKAQQEGAFPGEPGKPSDTRISTVVFKGEPDTLARRTELTPAAKQRRADLEQMLSNIVSKLVGTKTKVEFQEGRALDETKETRGYGGVETPGRPTAGVYLTADRIIKLALDSNDPITAAYHEAWHDIEFHLLNDREVALLKRETERLRPIAAKRLGISLEEAKQLEGFEVRAYAFEAYAAAREKGRSDFGMHTGIARIFGRLVSFFRSVRNGLSGLGFKTAEDVFGAGFEGQYAGRPDLGTRATDLLASRQPVNPVTSTAPQRQQAMQGFIARGQPLDRALRVPFDIFGGTTADRRWKPGQALFDKAGKIITGAKFSEEGRFAFLNPLMETARNGLIDRYSLRNIPEYVERERARSLDERAVMLKGAEVLRTLREHSVGPEEARVLQAILTGEPVTDADMQALAEPIRAAVDQLGQEAVALGLVSPESYERNRGTYLHRVYQKYESEQNGLNRMVNSIMGAKRKKIIGDQFRGRGMFHEIPLSRLMKDVPDWHEGARGKPENGEKFIRLDEMADQTEMELDGEPAPEKVQRTVWWPADRAIPDRYDGFRRQGAWEVRGEKGGKLVIWRDFTKAERTKMGEILDARYTIGKTFMLMAHDLANGRFYKDIAENEDWASKTPPDGKIIDAAEWQSQGLRYKGPGDVQWVKVPDTAIPDSGGKKRWGALAGMHVREEIWRDLNEMQVMSTPNVWRTLLTQWKLNKTARSPVVHMNNVVSNFLLMDMADIRAQDLVSGVRSYIKGDAHYQEAAENGAFGVDMISHEVRENELKPILEELEKSLAPAGAARLGALGQISRFTDALWTGLSKADRAMRRAYQVEDELFRMATYMRRRELGDSPKQAADAAREQFIDYDIRAPWVNAARNTVLPFISYTYRSVPMIAKAVATRPWKIGKYFLLAYALNALAYALSGGDEDKERRSLREKEQGRTWVGGYRMTRMPFNDKHGNPVFLDIRRWVPAGDVFDLSDGDMPPWLNIGGPLMIGAELALNRSAFTGRELFNSKTDDWFDRQSKRADHLYKSWMPSAAWVPGSWYWEKIATAARGGTDRQGNPYSVPLALSSSVGVKLKPQDVQDAMASKGQEFDAIERELKKEADRIASRKARNLISESEFNRAMNDIMSKREKLDKKAGETFK